MSEVYFEDGHIPLGLLPETQDEVKRSMDGLRIAKEGKVEVIDQNERTFICYVQGSKPDPYQVYGRYHRTVCTCPDHRYRHVMCKHIYAVLYTLQGYKR